MFLLLLSVVNSMAQQTVSKFEIEQCETLEFSVVNWPGDRYTWDLYTEQKWDTVNFAWQKGNVDPAGYFEKGMYEGSSVTLHWLEPGLYFLRVMVWDETNCNNDLTVFKINVKDSKPEAKIVSDSLCYGDPVVIKIVLTGMGPWDVKYTFGDGSAVINLNGVIDPVQTISLPPLPAGVNEIWVKEIIDQCTDNLIPSEKGRIVIYPKPVNSKIFQIDD